MLLSSQPGPVLAGSQILAALSYEQDVPVWQRSFARIRAVMADDEMLYVLADERKGGSASLYILDSQGRGDDGPDVGEAATGLDVLDGQVALGSGSRVMVIDGKSGKLLSETNLASDVIRLAFANADNLTVVTGSGVYRVPVRDS